MSNIKILNKLKQISKAYTEGVYSDSPANRKLGRVGMSYSTYSQKSEEKKSTLKKEESKENTNDWVSSITKKEDKELAIQASNKIISLGLELPKLSYKSIPKQYNFQPISGYDKSSNTLILNKDINIAEKGKEYLKKGWNSQNNPILHELSHYLAHNFNPNLNVKESLNLSKEQLDKVKKEVSEYAAWNKGEFSAELIAGILSGKKYSKEIMNIVDLKLNIEGKTPKEIFEKGIDFAKKLDALRKNTESIIKKNTSLNHKVKVGDLETNTNTDNDIVIVKKGSKIDKEVYNLVPSFENSIRESKFAILKDGKVIAGLMTGEEGDSYKADIAVIPNQRNKGLSKKLLTAMIKDFVDNSKTKQIKLDVVNKKMLDNLKNNFGFSSIWNEEEGFHNAILSRKQAIDFLNKRITIATYD